MAVPGDTRTVIFTLFLSFIHKVKRALMDKFLVCQLMTQVFSTQWHVMLLVHMNNPDKLMVEADKLWQLIFQQQAMQDGTAMAGILFSFK